MNNVQYTITDTSIAAVVDGKVYNVMRGTPNFLPLRDALLAEDEGAVRRNLTIKKSLEDWARGEFTIEGNSVRFKDVRLPDSLNRRIVEMATKGESPEPFFAFWERLQRNPSHRSVSQLWDFLNQLGIPLTPDGCFLAYKAVREDYLDVYSGQFNNMPGTIHEMPRNQISDDPDYACHQGFHVGALEYARDFGSKDRRIVICKVDPEHVVCVPKDHSFQKMRVCKYEVIGNHGTQLSSTVHEEPETEIEATDEVDAVHAEDDAEGNRTITEIKVPKKYQKYQAMDSVELLACSIDQLREYATHGLKIIGASKVPGGKVALIGRIMEVRR